MPHNKNVELVNYLLKWGLQILVGHFLTRCIFNVFISKNTIENQKFHFLTKIYEIQNIPKDTTKSSKFKFVHFNKVYKFILTQFLIKRIFFISISENTFKIQFFKQNMWDTKKTLIWWIICPNEVYKFSVGHFLTICIFYFFILKNTIENQKFHFVFKICEIRQNRQNAKLFTSIKSTNFVKNSLRIFSFLNI